MIPWLDTWNSLLKLALLDCWLWFCVWLCLFNCYAIPYSVVLVEDQPYFCLKNRLVCLFLLESQESFLCVFLSLILCSSKLFFIAFILRLSDWSLFSPGMTFFTVVTSGCYFNVKFLLPTFLREEEPFVGETRLFVLLYQRKVRRRTTRLDCLLVSHFLAPSIYFGSFSSPRKREKLTFIFITLRSRQRKRDLIQNDCLFLFEQLSLLTEQTCSCYQTSQLSFLEDEGENVSMKTSFNEKSKQALRWTFISLCRQTCCVSVTPCVFSLGLEIACEWQSSAFHRANVVMIRAVSFAIELSISLESVQSDCCHWPLRRTETKFTETKQLE